MFVMNLCKAPSAERPAPTPSAKERNKANHRYFGNSTNQQALSSRTRANRRTSGLRPQQPKQHTISSATTASNVRLNRLVTTHKRIKKRRANSDNDNDSDWEPLVSKKQRILPAKKPLPTPDSISHHELLRLQNKGRFTDHQMLYIMEFHRQQTGVRFLYQPNFIPFARQLHNIFSNLFASTDFKPAGVKSSLPAIFCTDLRGLLQQLEILHHKQIKIVHLSGDRAKIS